MLKSLIIKIESADVIVFDMDGTLIDSDLANFMSYKAAIRQVYPMCSGLTLTPNKRITRESIRKLIPNISEKALSYIVQEKNRLYSQFLCTTSINAKIISLLESISGKEVVLSTKAEQSRADLLLEWHGIYDVFSHKFYGGNIGKNNKYQRVVDTNPGKSIVVFDNEASEIQDAIRAGVHVDNTIWVR